MLDVKRLASLALLSMLVGAAIVGWAGVAAAADSGDKTFGDVSADHWAHQAVQNMIGKGIIDGYDDGTFRPGDSLTREQFAKLLTLALDQPLEPVSEATFSDVAPESWSFPYVETVKVYMEGYVLPIGKPFFDPGAVVTREDVAVALVKGMKLQTEGIDARSVIEARLTDYDDISPGLDVYVAAALQNRLIEGYPDGTFKPHNGLDRGAAATLLYRLLQSPDMPKMKEIDLTVSAPSNAETPMIQVSGSAGKETKLTLNGADIPHNGSFSRQIELTNGEGSYDFEFRAVKPNGRYKVVVKHVTFAIPDPKLTVEAPQSTDKQKVVVTGQVSDINDAAPVIRVNDQEVKLSANGAWSKELTLAEGDNPIAVTAVNKYDKTTVIERNVAFTVKPPELSLGDIPETVHTKTLKVTGKADDLNDKQPKLSVNGQPIESLDFAVNVTLKEGDNTLLFVAKNSWGKTTTITKKVNYVILPPTITIDPFNETSLQSRVTLKGSATDTNDPEPSLYVNDRYVSRKTFSTDVTLTEGDNTVTIKATNNLGKTSTVTKKITYVIIPPNLNIDPIPETSPTKTITVKASAADAVDRSPMLYLNGSYEAVSTFTRTVTLNEGMNTLTFKATNAAGKSTVMERKVAFVPPPPVIKADNIPQAVTSNTLYYVVKATDPNDSNPRLYVNNQHVGSGDYNGSMTLKEGENVIVFKSTNAYGKTSELTKTVTYTAPGPTVTVGSLPQTTSSQLLMISADAKDPNDPAPKLYMNGQYVQDRAFAKSVTLVPGLNSFEIKAVNKAGKTSNVVTVNVTYNPPAAAPPAPAPAR